MHNPTVSVIIPAYAQGEYLAQAIRSALGQTYEKLEVVVVDDASPDSVRDVVGQFDDPRVILLSHSENRGVSAARNTGIRRSSGSLVAFLDADDYFHPEKIATHVETQAHQSHLGVTYGWRFNMNCSQSTIRDIWQAPETSTLADLVLGFPFAPSDMVVRREWLERVGEFDEALVGMGEDLDLYCRLALAGCQMGGISRALTYRRFYSKRHLEYRSEGGAADQVLRRRFDLARRHEALMSVLDRVFGDERCPDDVRALRDTALARHSTTLALLAFAEGDSEAGQRFLRFAVDHESSTLKTHPSGLIWQMLHLAIADENVDHADLLVWMLEQFPPELKWIARDSDWAIVEGHLRRAVRAALWDRSDEAEHHLRRSVELGAEIDDRLIQDATHSLIGIECEYGEEAAASAEQRIGLCLQRVGGRRSARRLAGCFAVNRAFRNHRAARPNAVLKHVRRAFMYSPRYAMNRGVLSMLAHSLLPAARH